MKKVLALILSLAMALGMCVALSGCGEEKEKLLGMSDSPLAAPELKVDYEIPDDFKIGFICLHDENSTYDLNFLSAVDAIQEAAGLTDDQVIVKVNVGEDDACYNTAKDLATQGCDIIFANSFGHESFMIKAAKEFPDIQFCHATGTKAHTENLPNYHNAFANIFQGRYLAGVAAGLKLNEMIEAGDIKAEEAKMGYVGAFTYAEVISGLSSFYLGAKSVCPSVTMKVQFTGSWYDEGKEQEAANALLSKGCVLISQHADSMGAPSACEVKGVPNVSYNGSTYDACPETFIVSSAINWAPYFLHIIKCVNTDVAIEADWCGGIAEGSVVLSGINEAVAAKDTVKTITETIAKLKSGEIKVFDVTKDNYITVNGAKLTTYLADVDYDEAFAKDTEAIKDGYFDESGARSAPYFDILIDGIENVNTKF